MADHIAARTYDLQQLLSFCKQSLLVQKRFRNADLTNISQSRAVHALTEHSPAQASAIDSPAQFKIELILASKASQRHKQTH